MRSILHRWMRGAQQRCASSRFSPQPGHDHQSGWDRFWFRPAAVQPIARLRGALCLVTLCYFLTSFGDVSTWYGTEGLVSQDQIVRLRVYDDLANHFRSRFSPLFLTDNLWLYQAWLAMGSVLCFVVATGRGTRWAATATWLAVVGWANRSLWLAGVAETLLSLSWLAMVVAPPASCWTATDEKHWTAGLARRLLAFQATIVASTVCLTMLAGRVWWNGLGAYALVAPLQDRWIDLSIWLAPQIIHELLTHVLVWTLPVGVTFAWRVDTQRIGRVILIVWCVTIALLTSQFLDGASLLVMMLSIAPPRNRE